MGAQWRASPETYAYRVIGKLPVAQGTLELGALALDGDQLACWVLGELRSRRRRSARRMCSSVAESPSGIAFSSDGDYGIGAALIVVRGRLDPVDDMYGYRPEVEDYAVREFQCADFSGFRTI